MHLNPEIVVTILGASFIVLTVIEWLASIWMKKAFYTHQYLIINLSLASLQQITGIVSQLLFIGAFVYVQENWSVQQWTSMPEIAAGLPITFHNGIEIHGQHLFHWLLVLVMADFCQYWLHRLSHEVNVLWAGHIVHHSNTEYNYGVAVRQSFIEGFYTWVFYLPLALAGIPWELFISAYAISLLWQFFVHTRFIGKMGWLEHFMATPSHHRAHHGKNDIYLDKNYGALLIIWDKLFWTFQEETEPVEYGITLPLQHNHLLWINTHQHVHIFKMMRASSRWKEKLKVLFGLPSYVPKNIILSFPSVVEHHFSPQKGKHWYVYLCFLMTSIAGLYWMNMVRTELVFGQYVLLVFVMGGNLLILTGLLEDRLWANLAEVTKLCGIMAAGLFFLLQTDQLWISIGCIVYSLLFLSATYFLARDYRRSAHLSAFPENTSKA
jgi:alkylglycerol monooxygenase